MKEVRLPAKRKERMKRAFRGLPVTAFFLLLSPLLPAQKPQGSPVLPFLGVTASNRFGVEAGFSRGFNLGNARSLTCYGCRNVPPYHGVVAAGIEIYPDLSPAIAPKLGTWLWADRLPWLTAGADVLYAQSYKNYDQSLVLRPVLGVQSYCLKRRASDNSINKRSPKITEAFRFKLMFGYNYEFAGTEILGAPWQLSLVLYQLEWINGQGVRFQ